jgi:hypothetical protein
LSQKAGERSVSERKRQGIDVTLPFFCSKKFVLFSSADANDAQQARP